MSDPTQKEPRDKLMPEGRGDGMAEEQGKPLELGVGGPASSTPIADFLLKSLYDPAVVQLRTLKLELKLNTTFIRTLRLDFVVRGEHTVWSYFSQAAVDWP